jgi:hypothetical protein
MWQEKKKGEYTAMIGMLREEYDALGEQRKADFLKIATAKGQPVLTEDVFWSNFEKLDDYIRDNAADHGISHFEGGYIVYDYICNRFRDFMDKHGKEMEEEFRLFLDSLLEECTEEPDFVDTDGMNERLEELVVSMFTLIANKKKRMGKSKLDNFRIDYSWEDFRKDTGKKRLNKRRRKILSGVDESRLEWLCACDTYIYTAIALYYTKICQDEEEAGMRFVAPQILREYLSEKAKIFIQGKFKCNANVQINKAIIRTSKDKVHVHLNVDAEMVRGELWDKIREIIDEMIGKFLSKQKKEE